MKVTIKDELSPALKALAFNLSKSDILRTVALMNLEDVKSRTPVSTRYRYGLGTSREELPGTQRESWVCIKKGKDYFVTPNTPYSKRVLYILNLGSSGSRGIKVPTHTGSLWRFFWINRTGEWHILARRRIPPVYKYVGFVNDAIDATLSRLPEVLKKHVKALLEISVKP